MWITCWMLNTKASYRLMRGKMWPATLSLDVKQGGCALGTLLCDYAAVVRFQISLFRKKTTHTHRSYHLYSHFVSCGFGISSLMRLCLKQQSLREEMTAETKVTASAPCMWISPVMTHSTIRRLIEGHQGSKLLILVDAVSLSCSDNIELIMWGHAWLKQGLN